MEAASAEREIRAARNQAMFRYVNEQIVGLDATFGPSPRAGAVACECADLTCVQLLEIPRREYESVRQSPRTFVVLPTHVFPEVERVVATEGTYAVVEVIGEGIRVAEETDPRNEASATHG